MIRRLITWIWTLRWPSRARTIGVRVLDIPAVSRLLLPHFLVGLVAVIENERGELLLVHHTYRRSHPWGLPTGLMEHGEQPEAALRREIAEEAGIEVRLDPVWMVYASPRQRSVNIVFHGTALDGHFVPSAEISDARFFHPDAIPPILREQRVILARYRESRSQSLQT